MMKQNLGDLNGYLFESLERLSYPDIAGIELQNEIQRAKAIADVSEKIIRNGELALKTEKAYDRHIAINAKAPAMLESNTIEIIND